MKMTRLFEILDNYRTKFAYKDDALVSKESGIWKKCSAKEYVENSDKVSYGLIALGLKKGDRIVTISNNRPEWNFVDMGMLQTGIINIPVYPTISEEEYFYILNHAEPSLIILSDKQLLDKLSPIVSKIKSIKDIYSFNQIENTKHWTEIIKAGEKDPEKYAKELEQRKASVLPDDLATIIYTSGTTNNSKGVMLTHNNILSNVRDAIEVFPFNDTHRTLSFLPISHVFERTVNYYFQSIGLSIYYAENMGTIAENLREAKPHIFITVPRLIERLYDKIIGVGKDLKGIKKQIFFWSVNLGLRYRFGGKKRPYYNFKLKIANKIVFPKWREALGGEVQLIVAGGAALQPRLARVFNAAGLALVEGYGMTEAAPIIAVNRMPSTGNVMVGTVGMALPSVEIKIAEDGEILCRGENVMKGYYKEPEITKEVIDKDGWLHTGDIGFLKDDKFLKITDRKKEIFKLSSGKYVAPQVIENKCKESIFIEQTFVVGENEKFASALVLPNFSFLHNWCTYHNVKYRDNIELINNTKVIERFQREINEINKQLGQTEQIKRFRLVADEWSPQTGELSPTLKLKRRVVLEKYKNIIKEIYSVQKQNKV